MARAHFVSRPQSKLRITDKIIELNDVVWSIQNLVAITITRKTIHSTEIEPTFSLLLPQFKFPNSYLLVAVLGLIPFYFYSRASCKIPKPVKSSMGVATVAIGFLV
ncbi:hypothetical protein QN372_08470, partial [Undibacterium sp. RTI2.1]|uniref:hypothetical protein n=1 Tax=unclassified Undibacterium TaxID=2630295 RepID=UPI002B223D29